MVLPLSKDPLFDFELFSNNGLLEVRFGNSFPQRARAYLSDYVQKTHKYKNIYINSSQIRFSLYQPDLQSQAGKRMIYIRLLRKFRRMRLPSVATIGVTKHCQCQCAHCSADYHMGSPRPDLTDAELRNALQESSLLGATNLILLGGEPLIRKSLPDLIASINKTLSCVTLFSNAELLDPASCQKLKEAGLSGIFVSLDSPFAKEHDALRGCTGLFAKALAGIENAQKAGIPVAISSYLTSERVEKGYLEKTVELARDYKVKEVTFFDAIPVGRLKDGPASLLDTNARKRIRDLTALYRKKSDYPALSPQSILTSQGGSAFCFAANTQFYLSSVGEFCPCDFTPLSIGRYPQKSIAELWQELISSPFYKKRSKTCRMQDPEFRKQTIERIPQGAALPYPLQMLAAK